MCRRLSCLTCFVLVLSLVNSASAVIELKVDLADGHESEPWPKTFKGGDWTPWAFWGDDEDDQGHDGHFIKGFAGLDVNIGFCVAEGDSSPGSRLETSDEGEEKICNSWLESTDSGPGAGDIHLVIMGRALTAGEYRVWAYHNDAEDMHENMPYIHVGTYCDANSLDNLPVPSSNDCNGVVQIHDGETIDKDVPIQSLSYDLGLDSSLKLSLVKFTTDGNSSVLIKYRAGTGSSAIVNAFIIELAGEQVTAVWPEPPVGAKDLCPADVNLSWTPGVYAADHNVYFGPSVDDVNGSKDPCLVRYDSNTWTVPYTLEVDTTYYWRVDEVNDACDASPWKGAVWSFTTRNGKAYDPLPENNFRGFKASSLTEYSWTTSCVADNHKVYFGVDLPEYIDLFEDGFESGFDPNWVSDGWDLFDANAQVPKDMNLCHGPNFSARATSGGGTKTLTSAEANLADACSIQVEFFLRKVYVRDNELKLYYWDGGNWDFIKDLNTVDPCVNTWLHYSDDINVYDEYHLVTDFKIKVEANITDGGTVYIDDARIRNTWPAAAKWYKGRTVEPNYPVSPEPLTKYYWRIDTIIDGDVVQGDHWTFSTGLGGLIMWCTFDGGGVGGDFLTTYQPDTESGHTIEFTKYTETGGWVKYGEGNPMYNREGTSVNFDPNAGLYRLDPCLPKESRIEGVKCIDPLRLDGYQYTIEMWVKPTNLSEEDMDDQVLITKGGESEDDGEEWDPDTWGVIIVDPGTDDDDENQFRFYHGGGMSTDEDTAIDNEWSHIAAVYNQQHPDPEKQFRIYWNGILDDDGDRPSFNSADANSPVSIGFGLEDDANFANAHHFFYGMIDELRIYDIALKPYQFLLTPGPEWASYPRPFYGQVGVEPNDPNLALVWNPGTKADKHDVYLSTDFEDVNTGDLKAYIGRYDTNEANDVNAHLEVGRNYYWRVDEVNTADSNIWPGVIWRFTTEFPILDEHLVLWYPFDEDSGRFATDHSGYGNHGEIDLDMAYTGWEDANGHYGGCLAFDDDTTIDIPSDDEPSKVLDRVTDEITISVWLYGLRPDPGEDWDNDSGRVVEAGASTKFLVVRVPAEVEDDVPGNVYWRAGDDVNDALTWEVDTSGFEGDWHHFAFTKDESADKMYIYLDGGQVWWKPGDTDSSLIHIKDRPFEIGNDYIGKMDDLRIYDYAKPESEIEELYRGGDLASAWGPTPYDGQTDAPRDVNLAWNPGDYADSHDVYFGTDYNSVRDANTSVTLDVYRGNTTDEFNDIEILSLDTQYFWRIDEVKDSNGFRWMGNVWKFKVADYLIIDDMESYQFANDIREYWQDQFKLDTGWSKVTTGIYDASNPKWIPHAGDRMMRYLYENWRWPFYSEAYLPLEKVGVTNWTEEEVKALTLFFYGEPPSEGYEDHDQMYVGISSTDGNYAEIRYGDYDRLVEEDINDLNEPDWHRWFIGLPDFNDPCYAAVPNNVDFEDVNRLFIGFGDKRNPVLGGFGEIRFDDIRLNRSICAPEIIRPVGDFSGRRDKPDCVVDFWDIAYFGEHEWLRDDANLVDIVQEPCDANLIGHWAFDIDEVNDACDSSVYDHNGTIKGEYSWVVGHANDLNPSDRAVYFRRGRGRIVVDDCNVLRPKRAVTVSAWVYFTEKQDDARVVVKGADEKEAYRIRVDDWDELDFEVGDVCNAQWDAEPEFDDDEEEAEKEYKRELGYDIVYPYDWVHLAGTFDGDTNTVRAYVNAVLIDEANDANFVTDGNNLSQDTNDLAIGSRAEELYDTFKGAIDEVRIYDYALDANEIAWLATDGTGYRRLRSQLNLYDLEKEGEKSINFKDLAVLIDEHWLEEVLWP